MGNDIAYLCDGLDPKCSGKIGCFKCSIGRCNSDGICYHTLNPEHAVYGKTLFPGVWKGIRFKAFPYAREVIYYFEEWDEELIRELIDTGVWMLLPNEEFREKILEAKKNHKLIFSEGETNHD